jgi:nucleobase:cation symporter-1, NCS1 family
VLASLYEIVVVPTGLWPGLTVSTVATALGLSGGGAVSVSAVAVSTSPGPLVMATFAGFVGAQTWIVARGMSSIDAMQKIAAPILAVLCAAVLVWSIQVAGGVDVLFASTGRLAQAAHGVRTATATGTLTGTKFWTTFLAAVTANVGAWATMSLNISDITRYVKSQRAQVWGQALGLPLSMSSFALVGLLATTASVMAYGIAISNPMDLVQRLPGAWPRLVAAFGLLIATLSTNLAANLLAPATVLTSFFPTRLSLPRAAFVAALLGACVQPWRIMGSASSFVLQWLIGYSALLGPAAGVMVADYLVIRERNLDVSALYSTSPVAAYAYWKGVNPAAVVAVVLGALPAIPGFLVSTGVWEVASVSRVWTTIYFAAWPLGFVLGMGVYVGLMRMWEEPAWNPAWTPAVADEMRNMI